MTLKEMAEKFQCPGCVCGSNTECGTFRQCQDSIGGCISHVIGTHIGLGNPVAIGMPKGFNHPAQYYDMEKQVYDRRNVINIRLWVSGTQPKFNKLNVAVWAMEADGLLFVRTFSPRIDTTYVDVIEGGKLSDVAGAIDVSKFTTEID